MRVALYARVDRPAATDPDHRAPSRPAADLCRAQQGWRLGEEHIFRDDGHSGVTLDRPGLDALRDQGARAAL